MKVPCVSDFGFPGQPNLHSRLKCGDMKKILVIGGSNCIQKNGYGFHLQRLYGDGCENRSLGNSPSLRGVEFLLGCAGDLGDFDFVVFEYALNDLIFEAGNTLDPRCQLEWLRMLAQDYRVAEKLVFVMLHGKSVIPRLRGGVSFVWDNYKKVSKEYSIPIIDMQPFIEKAIVSNGVDGVFKGNDHFTPAAAISLAKNTLDSLRNISVMAIGSGSPRSGRKCTIFVVEPVANCDAVGCERRTLSTSLVKANVLKLGCASRLELISPGGMLLGFYSVISDQSGCVMIEYGDRKIIKSLRRRRSVEKPYLALRHLTMPLQTKPGDKIVVRFLPDVYSCDGAVLDNTVAQDLTTSGECVELGNFIFMVPGK